MQETVVTVVGRRLEADTETRAAEIVRAAGAAVKMVNVLHAGRAVDLILPVWSDALAAALRTRLATLGAVDVFVQPNDAFRRKKLLVADMDATMVVQETLDELAGHMNLKAEIAAITAAAMRGEVDFAEAFRQRIRLLKGLPVDTLHQTLEELEYSEGGAALVRTMRRGGAVCVLVSGGLDLFTGHVAAHLGFDKHFGNRLVIEDGRLTGEVIPPVIDKHVKEARLVEEAKALGCDPAATMAVGDGANDVLMLRRAGAGVGYFGKPAVQDATPHQVRHTDLTALLYMQGYTAADL